MAAFIYLLPLLMVTSEREKKMESFLSNRYIVWNAKRISIYRNRVDDQVRGWPQLFKEEEIPDERASQQELFIHFASVCVCVCVSLHFFFSFSAAPRQTVDAYLSNTAKKLTSKRTLWCPLPPLHYNRWCLLSFTWPLNSFPFLRPRGLHFFVFFPGWFKTTTQSVQKETKTSANKLQRVITHWGEGTAAGWCKIYHVCCVAEKGDPRFQEETFRQKVSLQKGPWCS